MIAALAEVAQSAVVSQPATASWFRVHEIQRLEAAITVTDGELDALRWEQAAHVAALKASGWSLRKIADRWINPKTEEPYHFSHVNWTLKVFSGLNTLRPRPNFRDAYNQVSNQKFCFGNGDDEWFTPKPIIEAARRALGTIDLDPASCAAANAVVKATRFFTIEDDGLAQPWSGTVFMNSPYSRAKIDLFVEKIVTHVVAGDVTAAIVLTNAETATRWFAKLYGRADAVCFPQGRLKFWKSDRVVVGQAAYASAICYFGPDPQKFTEAFECFGVVR